MSSQGHRCSRIVGAWGVALLATFGEPGGSTALGKPSIWEVASNPALAQDNALLARLESHHPGTTDSSFEPFGTARESQELRFGQLSQRADELIRRVRNGTLTDMKLLFLVGTLLVRGGQATEAQGLQLLSTAMAAAPNSSLAVEAATLLGNGFSRSRNRTASIRWYSTALRGTWRPSIQAKLLTCRAGERMANQELNKASRDYRLATKLARSLDVRVLAQRGHAVAADRSGDSGTATAALNASRSTGGSSIPEHRLRTSTNCPWPEARNAYYQAMAQMAEGRQQPDPVLARSHWQAAEFFWTIYLKSTQAPSSPGLERAKEHLLTSRRKARQFKQRRLLPIR